MHALGIVGREADDLLDRLLPALDGRVGVVRTRERDRPAGDDRTDGGVARRRERERAATTYAIGDGWSAAGDELDLAGALDRLAPDHDYAVAVGFPDARLPQVVLGDADARETLLAADSADAVDVDALIGRLEDTEPRETLESLVAAVKRSPRADRAGAIATFTGRVRAKDDPDDARTEFLEFEKYEGVADERTATIESELTDREGVLDVRLHHRTGVVRDGEDIVFVVVLAGHRREAFRAVEDGIDRLKEEVPLFKKEVTAEETFWVHERE
ncbi:MAG: molybdopterin synthase [Haloarculaceae archaeon]